MTHAPMPPTQRPKSTSCIFDTETGGLEPHHPTIQFALVAMDDTSFEEIDSMEVKLHFNVADCEPEALALNHYDPVVWEKEAVDSLTARMRMDAFFRRHDTLRLISKRGKPYTTARLIAHNAEFDVARLRELWGKEYTPFCWWYALDTVQLALWTFYRTNPHERPDNYRLETLCQYFGITTEGAHDALTDCRLTAKLIKALDEYAGFA